MSSKSLLGFTLAAATMLSVSITGFAAPQVKPAAAKKPAAVKKAATTPKPATAPKASAAPKLTLVEPLKDFGTIPKGEKINWSFVVKNTGTSDLQILSVEPTCGCTVADFDKVIKPGASGKVTAHVDTAQFNGPIQKAVNIRTNDPDAPNAQLTINAIIKPYVEAYPAGFLRYNVMHGETQAQSFVLYSEEELPFEIQKIEVPGNHVKATFTKIEKEEERAKVGRAGQNQYRVDVVLGGPDVQTGPIAEKMKIFSNSKRQPEYSVSLTGLIRPRFTVAPSILNFGEVMPGDAAASRIITLETMNRTTPELFKVTRVESGNPAIFAEVKPTEQKGRFEVSIKLRETAKPGVIDSSLKIHTNDEINPIVTIPMKGTVREKVAAK